MVLKTGKEKWPTWRHRTLSSVKWNEQAEISEKRKKISLSFVAGGKKSWKIYEFRSLSNYSMSWRRRMKESFIPNLFVLVFSCLFCGTDGSRATVRTRPSSLILFHAQLGGHDVCDRRPSIQASVSRSSALNDSFLMFRWFFFSPPPPPSHKKVINRSRIILNQFFTLLLSLFGVFFFRRLPAVDSLPSLLYFLIRFPPTVITTY